MKRSGRGSDGESWGGGRGERRKWEIEVEVVYVYDELERKYAGRGQDGWNKRKTRKLSQKKERKKESK